MKFDIVVQFRKVFRKYFVIKGVSMTFKRIKAGRIIVVCKKRLQLNVLYE